MEKLMNNTSDEKVLYLGKHIYINILIRMRIRFALYLHQKSVSFDIQDLFFCADVAY